MTTDAAALTAHADTHDAAPHGVAGMGNPVLGMLLFITSEVMFFAGLFAAYFSIRAGYQELNAAGQLVHRWPPEKFAETLKVLPLVFTTHDGQTALNLILPATIILVTSSFTCQWGVWAIRRGDRTGFLRNFGVTLVLGITFLLMQLYDYTVLAKEGLSLGADHLRDHLLHAHGLPRRPRVRRRADARRRRLPRDGGPVLGEAPRHGRGDVALLALRRHRVDPAVLDPLPAPGDRRMSRRGAVLVGLVFIVIAAIYWSVPYLTGGIIDYAGITMLLALGVAMTLMVWVLFSGVARS